MESRTFPCGPTTSSFRRFPHGRSNLTPPHGWESCRLRPAGEGAPAHPRRIPAKRRRRAKAVQGATEAHRALRRADFAAEVDQPQREGIPLLSWYELHGVLLDLSIIFLERH